MSLSINVELVWDDSARISGTIVNGTPMSTMQYISFFNTYMEAISLTSEIPLLIDRIMKIHCT
jgi:hypothetical protein